MLAQLGVGELERTGASATAATAGEPAIKEGEATREREGSSCGSAKAWRAAEGRGADAVVTEDEAGSTEEGRRRCRLDRFFFAGGDAGGGEGPERRRNEALESESSEESSTRPGRSSSATGGEAVREGSPRGSRGEVKDNGDGRAAGGTVGTGWAGGAVRTGGGTGDNAGESPSSSLPSGEMSNMPSTGISRGTFRVRSGAKWTVSRDRALLICVPNS